MDALNKPPPCFFKVMLYLKDGNMKWWRFIGTNGLVGSSPGLGKHWWSFDRLDSLDPIVTPGCGFLVTTRLREPQPKAFICHEGSRRSFKGCQKRAELSFFSGLENEGFLENVDFHPDVI